MKPIKTATDVSSMTTQTITFADRLVTLVITWNEVSGAFFADVSDGRGNTVYGIRMVENYPLLDEADPYLDLPCNMIVLQESEDAGPEITYANFGNGWNPYLITLDEADAWRAANGLA